MQSASCVARAAVAGRANVLGSRGRGGHPIVPTVVAHLAEAFKAPGGVIYVKLQVDHADSGPLTLTMQRRWGKSPGQIVAVRNALLAHDVNEHAVAEPQV